MFNVNAWPIGSQFSKYGDSELKLNTSAKIINSSTYVPLRFTSEALNMNVERDTVTKIVIINNKDKSPAEYIATLTSCSNAT
ncbi:stalk domain-containing protein [Desulfoscipio gibsoniae]|uniref:stalk domain-containing protein n=1 Tax=Desulfoscipio gibsoniae TaxID=102134 RepID=UPI000232B96A